MRLCVAQTKAVPGDIAANIACHCSFIAAAAETGADLIVFPELSLTGYEPRLAKDLAIKKDDSRLTPFQSLSDNHAMTICVGAPIAGESGISIGMIIFQPARPRGLYSKHYLHADELPYFQTGSDDLTVEVGGYRVAPAICYESLLPQHLDSAIGKHADIYLASVAKSQTGVEKARLHFSKISKANSMTVVFSNCVGQNDDFLSAGGSSVWDKNGTLIAQFDTVRDGLMTIDIDRGQLSEKIYLAEPRPAARQG